MSNKREVAITFMSLQKRIGTHYDENMFDLTEETKHLLEEISTELDRVMTIVSELKELKSQAEIVQSMAYNHANPTERYLDEWSAVYTLTENVLQYIQEQEGEI